MHSFIFKGSENDLEQYKEELKANLPNVGFTAIKHDEFNYLCTLHTWHNDEIFVGGILLGVVYSFSKTPA